MAYWFEQCHFEICFLRWDQTAINHHWRCCFSWINYWMETLLFATVSTGVDYSPCLLDICPSDCGFPKSGDEYAMPQKCWNLWGNVSSYVRVGELWEERMPKREAKMLASRTCEWGICFDSIGFSLSNTTGESASYEQCDGDRLEYGDV